MTIIKKPLDSDVENIDLFINGAPDSLIKKPRRVYKGNKIQITLTLSEALLEKIDALANQLGQSRAAIINLSIVQMFERGLRIEGMCDK